jgi:hypothetical protein
MLVHFIRFGHGRQKVLVLQTDANNKVHSATYNSSSDLPEDLRAKYFAQMAAKRMNLRKIKRSR